MKEIFKRSKAIKIKKFLLIISIIMLVYALKSLFISRNISKIRSQEEMFRFVIENQDELNQVVDELKGYLGDKRQIILSKHDGKLKELYNVNKLFEKCSISYIVVKNEDISDVDIWFDHMPKGYNYWGIYHSKTGEADDWGPGLKWTEEDGWYVQIGSYFRYETKQINDNWYYYQCNAH